MSSNIVAAIDIGTSKTYTLISMVDGISGAAKVIGYGIAKTSGVTQGIIVNPENAAKSIALSVKNAEEMASKLFPGIKVESAVFSVGDRYIESVTKASAIKLSDKPREITGFDKRELEDIVEKKNIDSSKQLIHKSVYNYRVDTSGILKDPEGKEGTRLEAVVYLVFCRKKSLEDINAAAEKAGIKVDKFLFKGWTTAIAASTEEERKSGIIIADVGAGNSSISIFKNGRMIYTTVIPMGGESFTNDIAVVTDIDKESAEAVKREIASLTNDVIKHEKVEIDSKGKSIELELLNVKEIIDARSEELLESIVAKIAESNFSDLAVNGIAFTGGAVKTAGFIDKARRVMNMVVRVAEIQKIKGFEDALYRQEGVTGLGSLISAVSEIELIPEGKNQTKRLKKEKSGESFFSRLTEKMKSFIFE